MRVEKKEGQSYSTMRIFCQKCNMHDVDNNKT